MACGCGAPAVAPVAPIVAPVVATPPPAAPALAAARWVQGGGRTATGPLAGKGTMVLLGGRRAIVEPDGSVQAERAPSPEPIVELIQVPVDGGERRLVGRGAHGIFRFDDPLGAPVMLARSEAPLVRLGAGPGIVAVWDATSDLPRFVDVGTGRPASLPGLPALPARAMAFRDMREGAAVFAGTGLAVTIDGGATFRAVAVDAAGDALRVSGLRLEDQERGAPSVRAYVYAEGRDAEVDLAGARIGAMEERAHLLNEPATLRWVRVTGRDPLEAAVTSGVSEPSGGALVASHGLLARVDLGSGAITEIAQFASGRGECSLARSGERALVACALGEESEGDLYDPFGVFVVPLGGKLEAGRPIVARNGEAAMRTSPRGGAMLLGACHADEEGSACVLQPDGSWVTSLIDADLVERGAGPLADGRVAFVRGLFEGDDPPLVDGAGPPEAGLGWPAPYVVAVDASGAERVIGASTWVGRSSGELRLQSPVQEAPDGALRFVLANDEGVFAFALPREGGRSAPQRVEGAREARLQGDHGVALGSSRIAVTLDGGARWLAIDAPPPAPEALAPGPDDGRDPLFVGDVGLAVDDAIRIGWGPPVAASAPPAAPPAPTLEPRAEAKPAGTPHLLRCTLGAPSQSVVDAFSPREVKGALATATKPPKGTRRTVSAEGSEGLDPSAVLEEQGPDEPGSAPTSWTLRWHDPREVGGKLHTWTGAPPKGAGWGSALRSVYAAGPRALFAIRTGGRYTLVRASGAKLETALVPFEMLPGDVVLGDAADEPIAWLSEGSLVVWRRGSAPRVVTSMALAGARLLGEPTKEGVPMLIGASDWMLLRTLALPLAAPKGEVASVPAARPPVPSFEGWEAVASLRRDVARLPACAKAAKGQRFSIPRSGVDVSVEGVTRRSLTAAYGVIATATEACVASVAAVFAPEGRAKGASTPMLRADLRKQTAEGSAGLDPAGKSARKLTCTLSPRP